MAVWGGDDLSNPTPLLFAESTGSADALALGRLFLESGVFPRLALDRAGLPVVFFLSTAHGGELRLTRCVQRPCSETTAHWVSTTVLPGVASFTAGSDDAGTWFLAETDRLRVGREQASGSFTLSDFGMCAPVMGQLPSADRASPSHAAFARANEMWFHCSPRCARSTSVGCSLFTAGVTRVAAARIRQAVQVIQKKLGRASSLLA